VGQVERGQCDCHRRQRCEQGERPSEVPHEGLGQHAPRAADRPAADDEADDVEDHERHSHCHNDEAERHRVAADPPGVADCA
jgi:hypothetical protein